MPAAALAVVEDRLPPLADLIVGHQLFDSIDWIWKDVARMNGAESLIRTLIAGGVEVCFANPGTSEMHVLAALDRIRWREELDQAAGRLYSRRQPESSGGER